MIDYLSGILVDKNSTSAVVEVNGVGYQLNISTSTFADLPNQGNVKIYTYLHVREDAMILFGFLKLAERELFLDLLGVSGIGPKLAMTIVSALPTTEIYRLIASDDQVALQRIPGLGKKGVQRLVMDLREKATRKAELDKSDKILGVDQATMHQAIQALTALGFSEGEAKKAISEAVRNSSEKLDLEELVRLGLQNQ